MSRTKVEGILGWLSNRGSLLGSTYEFGDEIEKLQALVDNFSDDENLYIFIPIRLVTLIEVFVREKTRNLVNADVNFDKDISALVKNVKFDIDFAKSLANQKLSLGDIVALTQGINSYPDCVNVFKTLIPNFNTKIREIHERWDEDKNDWPLDPIIEDYDNLAASLTQLFRDRHVLVHELPEASVVDKSKNQGYIDSVKSLISAVNWLEIAEIYGSVPQSQAAMNDNARETADEARQQMLDAYKKLESAIVNDGDGDTEAQLLADSQQQWDAFADSQAKLAAAQVDGGSLWPTLYSKELEQLHKDRAEQLKEITNNRFD